MNRRGARDEIVRELTRIKAAGIARTDVGNCPVLLSIAIDRDAPETGRYGALLDLLNAALASWTEAPGVAAATTVLLGLERESQFVTLAAGRRPRAAELVEYSVSTMARRKESEYLTRFADAILSRRAQDSPNPTLRSSDGPIST